MNPSGKPSEDGYLTRSINAKLKLHHYLPVRLCAILAFSSYNAVMTRASTYQAAHAVAATIEAHFAEHLADARARGESGLAQTPSAGAIERMIDAAFWASFRPEEGRFPKISLAYLSPADAGQPLIFERSLPLTAGV